MQDWGRLELIANVTTHSPSELRAALSARGHADVVANVGGFHEARSSRMPCPTRLLQPRARKSLHHILTRPQDLQRVVNNGPHMQLVVKACPHEAASIVPLLDQACHATYLVLAEACTVLRALLDTENPLFSGQHLRRLQSLNTGIDSIKFGWPANTMTSLFHMRPMPFETNYDASQPHNRDVSSDVPPVVKPIEPNTTSPASDVATPPPLTRQYAACARMRFAKRSERLPAQGESPPKKATHLHGGATIELDESSDGDSSSDSSEEEPVPHPSVVRSFSPAPHGL